MISLKVALRNLDSLRKNVRRIDIDNFESSDKRKLERLINKVEYDIKHLVSDCSSTEKLYNDAQQQIERFRKNFKIEKKG